MTNDVVLSGKKLREFILTTTALYDTDDPADPHVFSAGAVVVAVEQAGYETTQAGCSIVLTRLWRDGFLRRSRDRIGPSNAYLYHFAHPDRTSERPGMEK